MAPDIATPDQTHALFLELISQHQNQLFGFLLAAVRNRADAMDLYQQTLLVLWKKFDSFEQGTNFSAWAFRIAEIEVRRYRHDPEKTRIGFNEHAVALVADAMHDDAESGLFQARQEALPKCLAKLSAPDRELIEQVYSNQKRVIDIAAETGRIPQSVTNSLRRIRRALFRCIERTVPGEGGY